MVENNNEMIKILKVLAFIITGVVIGVLASLTFTSCTISVNTLHTQGEASDVIDETQSPSQQVNPELNIPVTVPTAK